MAKGPAVVVVARHGARLDAADKQWHLTSPTPYDPPLTYGGWSQGKALGLRIASLLHARETQKADEAKNGLDADVAHNGSGTSATDSEGKSTTGASSRAKKRKHKIIIHSSPFLRCIQTSTAVAAGISQFQPPQEEPPATPTTLKVPQPTREIEKSPLAKSPSNTPAIQPVRGRAEEPESPPKPLKSGWLRLTNPAVNSKPYIGPEKILLRIDAFLGEWLSPDYYEDITPPPNSTMMVAGAKADLLRRSDYIEAPPKTPSSKGHFPGGWIRSNAGFAINTRNNSRQNTQDGQFPTMGSLGLALPHRERASSHGSMLGRQRSRSQEPHTPVELTVAHKNSHLYDAPNPSYAVSPSDPIPRGYANHARDACLKVDFQWDSMREPQQWGDGGEFGDEWSTMHKRFRRGFAGMMQWYREHGTKTLPPQNMFPGFTFTERLTSAPRKVVPSSEPKSDEDDEDDEDEELVLILVTHGAGCNALLGAITNQPVLMDISLASLSMAVRREVPRTSSTSTIYARRSSVVDPGMADTYEMKLMASVDHLRPGVDPSKPPQPQSTAAISSPSIRPSRRLGTSGASTPVDQTAPPFSPSSPARSGWNSSVGIMRKTSRDGSGSNLISTTSSGSVSPSVGGGTGLWGGALKSISFNETQQDGRASPGADMVAAFNSHSNPTSHTIYSQALNNASSTTSTIYAVDGPASPKTSAVNGNEDNEKHDDVAPLFVPKKTASARASGGLWGTSKPQVQSNGLWHNSSVMWGPPRLDEVYEHGRGPKRRWTMTERE